MKSMHICRQGLYIVASILMAMVLFLYPAAVKSHLSDPPARSHSAGKVQSQRQPSKHHHSSSELVKTYKPMKNVSGPTGLNSNTRYRELMERDKERSSE